jgi:broad specificity phosphatase PhoE
MKTVEPARCRGYGGRWERAMTMILWVRHTEHELGGGILAGRAPGVQLSARGREHAALLAERLTKWPIAAVYCGPLERARQTAAPLAALLGLEVAVLPEIDEVEFGRWTGKRFEELDALAGWQRWNTLRGWARPPGGEMMLQVQARAAAAMERMQREHTEQTVALFSHGDVIRAAVAHALGVHIDLFLRIEIGLGSVSALRMDEGRLWVVGVNGKWGEFGEGQESSRL